MSNDIPTPPSTSISDPPSPTEIPEYSTSRRPSNNPFNYPPPLDHDDSDDDSTHPNHAKMARAATSIVKTTMTTITPITFHPKPIYVVVATALNPPMGIGFRGGLPWKGISGDMAFFRNLTSHVPESAAAAAAATNATGESQILNALIMGRKTWESIPPKFRPLAGRLNVIVTRGKVKELGRTILEELQKSNSSSSSASSRSWETQDLILSVATTPSKPSSSAAPASSKQQPDGTQSTSVLLTSSPSSAPPTAVLVTSALPSILTLLSSDNPLPGTSITTHKVFCIGGAELYAQTLALSHTSSSSSIATERNHDESVDPLSPPPPTEADANDADLVSESDAPAFDIRVLQTQVHKLSGEPFEIDTYFPENLSYSGGGLNGSWHQVSTRTLDAWTDGVEVPGIKKTRPVTGDARDDGERGDDDDDDDDDNGDEEDEDESDGWVRDDKAGVEFRIVGWERQ